MALRRRPGWTTIQNTSVRTCGTRLRLAGSRQIHRTGQSATEHVYQAFQQDMPLEVAEPACIRERRGGSGHRDVVDDEMQRAPSSSGSRRRDAFAEACRFRTEVTVAFLPFMKTQKNGYLTIPDPPFRGISTLIGTFPYSETVLILRIQRQIINLGVRIRVSISTLENIHAVLGKYHLRIILLEGRLPLVWNRENQEGFAADHPVMDIWDRCEARNPIHRLSANLGHWFRFCRL